MSAFQILSEMLVIEFDIAKSSFFGVMCGESKSSGDEEYVYSFLGILKVAHMSAFEILSEMLVIEFHIAK